MIKHITLKSKLLLSFFLVTTISIATTTLVSIQYFSGKINDEAIYHMRKNIQVAELIYEGKLKEIHNLALSLSSDGTLQLLVKMGYINKIEQYLSEKPEFQKRNIFITLVTSRDSQESQDGIPLDIVAYGGGDSEPAADVSPQEIEDSSQNAHLHRVLRTEDKAPRVSTELVPSMSGTHDLLSISAASAFSGESRLIGGQRNTQDTSAVLIELILNDTTEIIDEIQKLLGVKAVIYQNYDAISFRERFPISREMYTTLIQGSTDYQEENEIHQGGHLAQYVVLRDLNNKAVGVLGIRLSTDALIQTLRRAVYTLIGIMLACIIGAQILAYFLARSILIPINNLLHGVKQITGGDLSHKLKIRSKNELGILAMAFNSMARQLKELFSNQEQLVQERTEQLHATLAYMAAIIDNMADGLLVTDPNTKITRTNPALSRMLGLDDRNIVGEDSKEVFEKDIIDLVKKTSNGTEKNGTAEINLTDGRIGKAVAAAIYKDPMLPEDVQECIGSVILTRDITREKEVDQMKTDFISTVSHELRTPLTSVVGFAKIIKKRFEKVLLPRLENETERKTVRAVKQVKENLDIIIAEGERLTTLINDVLDVAKMEAGKIDWNMEKLSIVDITERATVATSALFAKHGLAQLKDIEEDLPEIIGDRDRLIQVVINMISNAVKFTDEGSVTCRIRKVHNEIVVSIIDTGEGIAKADQPKVFEKFKQVGDTLTGKAQGTGLGLPICKQIVEHHGGKIWVESQPGEGSTFLFTLPVLTAFKEEVRIVNRDTFIEHLKERAAMAASKYEGQKNTILVVDDDDQIRKLLREELEPEGYAVREAQNGKEAIEQVRKELPRLIILDIMMPEMNGFEAAGILKTEPMSMDIPIIILSAIEEQEIGYHFGADSYLTKPIDTQKLLQEVATLLSRGSNKKKVFVAAENVAEVNMLTDLLRQKYDVCEVYDFQELKTQSLADAPDMIIVDAMLAEKHDIMNTLRSEKELEHVFFLLLEEGKIDDTHRPQKTA